MHRGSASGGRGRENEGVVVVVLEVVVGGGGLGVRADYPLHLAQLCRPTHSHQSGTPYLPEA